MTNPQITLYSIVKFESFISKIRNKTRVSVSGLLLNTVLKVLARAIRQDKEMKGIRTGKKEVKLFIFADDIILCRENPKNKTKKTVITNQQI